MDERRKTLAIKEAYRFGVENSLEQEMAQIRDMGIKWKLSYTTSLRRGYVIDLFTKRQIFDIFKKTHWPVGDTPWGQMKSRFWLRLKDRYEDFLADRGETAAEANDPAEEQAFAAEADLRDFLANNLECVEAGLLLYRQEDRSGVEFPVDDGRIDILAVDKAGRFVVFELKLARGRNKALGQLLYYMGWIDKHLGKGPCRGVVVAREISDDLLIETQRVQGVSLYRYKLSVSVERVT